MENKAGLLMIYASVFLLIGLMLGLPDIIPVDGTKYRVITIDSDYVDNDLTNFPLLVVLDNSTGDYSFHNDGEDIRFYSTDNVTMFAYEIEKFDNSGESYIWVNISETIESDTDYKFLVKYNNSCWNDAQNPNGVWDSNYKSVFHMNDVSSGIVDSTVYGKDGTENGNPTYRQTGHIGYSIDFDNNADYFSLDTDYGFSTNDWSLESWIKGDTFVDNDHIISLKGEVSSAYQIVGTELRQSYYIGGWYAVQIVNPPSTGTWIYGVATYDNDVCMKGYYQGNLIATNSNHGNIGTSASITSIGGRTNDWFDGLVDEVRISDIPRSDTWIEVSYHSMNRTSGFLTIGEEV